MAGKETFSQLTTDGEPNAYLQAVADSVRLAGVPKRFRIAKPHPLTGPKTWAYITGGVGSGKTYTACGILRAYCAEHARSFGGGSIWSPAKAHFVTAGGYLAAVKQGFDERGNRARRYRESPFLVLDDLGQEVPTQWAVAELFDLINYRYSEELPTIITSQFSRGAIARRLATNGGEEQALAIASRLAEACEVINLGETDRRLA